MRTHILKVWPSYFADLESGRKRFEVRSTRDRDFAVGDVLVLREWDPADARAGLTDHSGYTSQALRSVITYVLPGGRHGIDEHTAVLSLSEPERGAFYHGEFTEADPNRDAASQPNRNAETQTAPVGAPEAG
jgi:hypothetical protein